MENSPQQPQAAPVAPKKQKVGGVPGWIFGVLFLIGGISNLFTGKIIGGILTLVLALFLLPPTRAWFEAKIKYHFKPGIMFLISVVMLVIIGLIAQPTIG